MKIEVCGVRHEVVYEIRCDPDADGLEIILHEFSIFPAPSRVFHTIQETIALLPEEHR
jgi:hypothetical protein